MPSHPGALRLHHRPAPAVFLFLSAFLLILAACGGTTNNSTSNQGLAPKQVLTLPNVGTSDIGVLDPALGPDSNSALAVTGIYSGLVKTDKNLNVLPDQATWTVSSDNKVYTFHIKSNVEFSDGTPVTAQTYVYTLTRALLPEVKSPIATFFEGSVVGANDVNAGKTRTLAGVKALDPLTLAITLTQPTPYFLEVLTNALYFPLNEKLITQYGQADWVNHAVGTGVGTGPLMIKEWDHNVKMILVPNPHYYGTKTKLTEVDMIFVKDVNTAFESYRAKQYDLVWNVAPSQIPVAKNMPGYVLQSLLQTELLFFKNTEPPFDKVAVRQAFAYAIDKSTLAHAIFKDAVKPAPSIIPPGMPGYQPNYAGLGFDRAKAKSLFQSVYPDVNKAPQITFTYPASQVSDIESSALQQMWQNALGIQVKLRPEDLNNYNVETAKHQVQFGFTQWGADFPDPYDWLTLNLITGASNNNGDWSNARFDQLCAQAEKTTGEARIALYNQAEQIAVEDVGWLPLDHQALAAVIPAYVHGIGISGEGLFFGDWSNVYLLNH